MPIFHACPSPTKDTNCVHRFLSPVERTILFFLYLYFVQPSLQCRRCWWSFECFAAILDSLQTGRIGARMTECRRGWGGLGRKTIFLSPPPFPIFLSSSHASQTFYLAPTLHCFSISRWRPEQFHSPRQNPPALQASSTGCSLFTLKRPALQMLCVVGQLS